MIMVKVSSINAEDERLVRDIHELQDKIGATLDYYLELKQQYGELPGWEMVEDRLVQAIGWAETPIEEFEVDADDQVETTS